MQRRSSPVAVLRVEERGMSARQVHVAPVEGKGLTDAAAGEEHERNQRHEMRGTP
jgi:hypothetical protein